MKFVRPMRQTRQTEARAREAEALHLVEAGCSPVLAALKAGVPHTTLRRILRDERAQQDQAGQRISDARKGRTIYFRPAPKHPCPTCGVLIVVSPCVACAAHGVKAAAAEAEAPAPAVA